MIYAMIGFEKTGNLKYISHLDLQRAMTRLLVRSRLPVVYTEGFNPHPRLTFAQPLSIFQESVCEIAEFRIEDVHPSEEEALKCLQAVAPEGLVFTRVWYSERKLKPCVSASYELTFRTELSAAELEAACSGEMVVLKKSKTKEAMVDIAPMVTNRKFMDLGSGKVQMNCILPCGTETLNPSYVGAFLEGKAELIRTLRTELFF